MEKSSASVDTVTEKHKSRPVRNMNTRLAFARAVAPRLAAYATVSIIVAAIIILGVRDISIEIIKLV